MCQLTKPVGLQAKEQEMSHYTNGPQTAESVDALSALKSAQKAAVERLEALYAKKSAIESEIRELKAAGIETPLRPRPQVQPGDKSAAVMVA